MSEQAFPAAKFKGGGQWRAVQFLTLQIKHLLFYLKDCLEETSTAELLGMGLREFKGEVKFIDSKPTASTLIGECKLGRVLNLFSSLNSAGGNTFKNTSSEPHQRQLPLHAAPPRPSLILIVDF